MSSPVFSSKNSKMMKVVLGVVVLAILAMVVYKMVMKNKSDSDAFGSDYMTGNGYPNASNYPMDVMRYDVEQRIPIDQPLRNNYPRRNIRRKKLRDYFDERLDSEGNAFLPYN